MDQEKIGKLIKNLRKDNNLTQSDLADKLGVTYQAVSKWESGKNLPDIATLKEISKLFNINIDNIINGKNTKNKKNKFLMISIALSIILFIVVLILIIHLLNDNKKIDDFNFKVINTTCENFKINGTLAYNKTKSYIYISNVEFCGEEDIVYSEINCILYEKENNIQKEIAKCHTGYNETLKDHLKNVKLNSDNYNTICSNLDKREFYLEINVTYNDKTTTYKIPLEVENTCIK